MSLSFPKAGNWTEIVGQTPWLLGAVSAQVPLDLPVATECKQRDIAKLSGIAQRETAPR